MGSLASINKITVTPRPQDLVSYQPSLYAIMAADSLKTEKEKQRRRKKTLLKKAYELGKLCDVDVAVIIHKNGRYHTYRSNEYWLPCMTQIVSSTALIYLSSSSNQNSKLHTLFRRICFHRILKLKSRIMGMRTEK